MRNSCFLLLLTALLALTACEDEETREKRRAMINEAYEERITKYREDHARKCQNEVFEMAKYLADSAMFARARNIKVVDSLSRPPKPDKPLPPPTKVLEDTLDVAPLLPLDSLAEPQ